MSPQRGHKGPGDQDARHEKRRAPAPRSALRRRAPGRFWIPVFAVFVVGALGMWALLRQRPGPPHPVPISTATMAESVLVADTERDLEGALRWARRMVAAEPTDPLSILLLGVTWHNYATVGPGEGRERSATRTSLERIEIESRALALIDSAAAGLSADEQWSEAMISGGQVYEVLGLPLDALQYYIAVQRRLPNRPAVLSRTVFVEESLRDPLTIPSGQRTRRSP